MLLKIFAPVIFLFGLLGNTINLYVFTRPALRGLSTFRFLVYLSLIDFLFILIGIPHIISITYAGFDFRDYSDVLCSLHTFFTIFLSHLSSNVLAVVGVFRCVTINTMKPNAKGQPHLNLRKQNKQSSQPSAVNKRRQTGPKNDGHIHVVKSSNARISSKFFIISFFSEFGSADLITMSTCAILFLFDFHFLIWMRLAEHVSEPLDNLRGNQTDASQELSVYSLSNRSSDYPAPSGEVIRAIKCYPSPYSANNYFVFYTKIWVWIDLFLYSYIPFVIMTISTILIIYRLVNIDKNLSNHSKSKKCASMVIKANDLAKQAAAAGNGQDNKATQQLMRSTSESRSLIEIKLEMSGGDGDQRNDTNASQQERLSDNSTKLSQNMSLPKHKLAVVSASDTGSANIVVDKNQKRRAKKNNQIYKLLLTLNIFFFVLVSPLVTANTLGYLNQDHELFSQVCYILAYLNHCLNFLFYGMSCSIYRQILIDKFTKLFSRSYCATSITKPVPGMNDSKSTPC